MSLHIHRMFVTLALTTTVTLLLVGCESVESRRAKFDQGEVKYYRTYMDGDVGQAKQSLKNLIKYYHSPEAKVLQPSDRANALLCAYGRLYVLEKRVGDKDDAEVALTKARYWHLRCFELSCYSGGLHSFLSYQTPNSFEDTMSKLDKGANHGRAPRYVQDLSKSQPNTALEPTPHSRHGLGE